MFGTIVNALSIIIGSAIGFLFLKGRLNEKTNESVVKGTALTILLIGLNNALAGENMLLMIFSMVIGTFIGESIHIEEKMEHLGKVIESKFKSDNNIAKAFVTSSLLFCVGSMAILGALEGGLKGQHEILYAKSVLDGIISVMFATTLGIGVIFSAIPVLLYQGAIVIGAGFLKDLLTDPVVANMNGIGGLLIIALSLNMLEVKHIRVGNMLPAVFIPILYEVVLKLL
ncbi:MAG: DUF554 domain-containing protein [Spirochaetaceae bacterium]|jgi:uncharacterized membrane protein YqgA involved in biofilm formation|nr:DUF554 domain-containing protein [Spirochaetaceae bacterium]